MNSWPQQDKASLDAYFGRPDANGDGLPDRDWEARNLTLVAPPYPMVLAWDLDKPVRVIRCHKKVAPSLLRVLGRIAAHYGSDAAIRQHGLHLYGGAYCFRVMRGGHALSVHSWGAAIDLDPAHNPFGGHPAMDPQVVGLFAAEGWVWGGDWTRRDGMHFQATQP